MTNTTMYIQRALEANPLREPIMREVIHSVQLPYGSHGLDAGSGIGLQTVLLAEAVGPAGQIIGLDMLPGLLEFGKQLVEQAGCTDEIQFSAGDVSHLPFEAASFDWAWSADCIGYPAGDMIPLLHELIRVLKPGGRILLLGWTSQQLLPGYPVLEARLNATCSAYLPLLQGKLPQQHFLLAIDALRQAGLVDIMANSFVRDIQSPLSRGERTAMISLFEMLWGQPQPGVAVADWHEFQRLCLPESPDFILDLPDYYGFFTYTLLQGCLPDN